MQQRGVVVLFILTLLMACDETTTQQIYNQPESAEALPTGALVISGTIENGEDPENDGILENQEVALVRNDGVVIAEGRTATDGSFDLDLAPGALVIDTSYSSSTTGLLQEIDAPSTKEFAFTLEAKIPNDGNGKALGVRKRLDLRASALDENGIYQTGTNPLREISAIVGTVSFAEEQLSSAGVDVFIPGKPYFVRTGDEGSFSLLFVPAGSYTIRLTKGIYIKDVAVTVVPGKTLSLDDVVIAANERNPLPLAEVLPGKWSVNCYYSDIAIPVSPDAPLTGTLTITAFDDVSITDDSCLFRTRGAADSFSNFQDFRLIGDGAIITKFGTTGFYFSRVTAYTNNEIVIDVDSSGLGGNPMFEVWQRLENP